jgi:ABC-type glycerol-3-phosphate transport system substrate-binding protein
LVLLLAACGSKSDSSADPSATSDNASTKKVTINFYGQDPEWSSTPKMIEATQKKLKDRIELKPIQVDFANLEKVIKTGIASGTPADIYMFWPQNMKTFVQAGQALDLTPYLEANNGEWKKTFNPNLLEIANYDGKYYNVPVSSNFSVLFVNKAIFEQAGVAIPGEWNWEEFMAACKTIKEKTGVFPFAIQRVIQEWPYRNGLLSLAKKENKLEELAQGKVPATDPIFRIPLQNIKELYDKQYWYPGQGALTTTKEEAYAAFMQGKVAMLAEVATDTAKIFADAKANNIDAAVVAWPAMGGENVILGGADGFFIPSNAPHKEEAVEVLKTFLSTEVQQIHADEGYPAANIKVKVQNEAMNQVIGLASHIYPYEFMALSPKISDYIMKEMIPNYLLGQASLEEILNKLEQLRLEAVQ